MLVDFYQTAAGREVIKEFLNGLPDKELAKVLHEIELLECMVLSYRGRIPSILMALFGS